ncbi:lef5 [Oxyplax ochracea nucleopolyhedrovirus]|uniref:Lef5 n=1 Tax=Oxyplax ochracea nucleopolyhedrovirus TaxID=2083176 RepID=A0A2L0WU20_9ABAC|nr:lef5 [Oxyplax ochracea nucleopolyhedrovirus]AVA31143.1 lef5 [Oxyplax ochracea nucleopolyhedrovirus]
MAFNKRSIQAQTNPLVVKQNHDNKKWTSRALFNLFKEFRLQKNYSQLIEFLMEHFSNNVKNKTFNFISTGHLFHSLYAYIPSVSNLVKERKQIRLQTECIAKLFNNTINDFKLYAELFDFIEQNKCDYCCPCQLLQKSLLNTKNYVDILNCKQFDIKPPKFKKEPFDNILYKYSLNYKNLLLKKKDRRRNNNEIVRKKIKHKQILNNTVIYLHKKDKRIDVLPDLNGLSLKSCNHIFAIIESQTRAGDEIVSFINYCTICGALQ